MINHHSIRYRLLRRTSAPVPGNREREQRQKESYCSLAHTLSSNQPVPNHKPEPVQVHCIKEQLTRVAIYARSQDSDQEQKVVWRGAWHPPGLFFLYIYPSPSPEWYLTIHKEYLICPQEPPRKVRKYITLTPRRVKQLTVKQSRREVKANERL